MTSESYPTSAATVCACEMPLVAEGELLGTARWYSLHRTRHLERFPLVDRVTRANLDLAVAWAREREDASAVSPDFAAVRDAE